jgi:glycosyltransferase involved in cell wall biosynthesis
MNTPAVIIYKDFDPFYHSLYIQGIHALFPSDQVRYSFNDFPRGVFRHQLALIVNGPTPSRVYVCHSDYVRYEPAGLEWSELYAKINIDPASPAPRRSPEVLPIGPSFAIRIYSFAGALYRSLAAFRWWDPAAREHFANYYRQRRYRLPESAYVPAASTPDYLFFAGSLWPDDPATNQSRAEFIQACRAVPGLQFEGGFTPRPQRSSDPPGFEHLTVPAPYSFREYLDKTRRSLAVFNTPAVGGCLGWKLGEFLALGKAIISTPLNRVLPAPLVHGDHIHYVEPTRAAITDAVEQIRRDDAYRRRLEQRAREYYVEYLAPAAVMSRIVAAVNRDRT